MPPLRLLLRAALRLHEIYLARAGQAAEKAFLDRLADYHPTLLKVRSALTQMGITGNAASSLPVRRQLRCLVQVVQNALTQTRTSLARPIGAVCDQRYLLDELQQLDDEFSGLALDVKHKQLSVTTEPIELEDVYLGPFTIRLSWERLARDTSSHCFEIVALRPNPAATKESVTHPHVNDGVLCAGDATIPIQFALEQGRLADAFCLVRSVLTTYNPSSPYVALSEWGGEECYDCGPGAHADDLSYCESCCHDYCEDCILSCSVCNQSRCGECLQSCPFCADSVCSGCLRRSERSGKACCRACLLICSTCGAAIARAELVPNTQSCPTCVPETATAEPAPSDELSPIPQPSPTEDDHEPTLSASSVC